MGAAGMLPFHPEYDIFPTMNSSNSEAGESVSFLEYLRSEMEAEERHEYISGRLYAMAGATEMHEIVAGNFSAALLCHMRGKKCRVFKGGMKVRLRLNATDLFYYPDALVTCDPGDSEPLYKERPKVIVEVMSDYKADHVEKLFAYQQIESLEEYLVIDQNPKEMRAWLYRKDRNWAVSDGAPAGLVRLESLGFTIPLADLYVME